MIRRLGTPALALGLILGLGLAVRLVLGFVVFPGQGLAHDLRQFALWAETIGAVGPGAFYANAASADYPPGYLYVLWLVGAVGSVVGPVVGASTEAATTSLLKAPAILADLAIALLLAWAGRRWFGGWAGVVAAALYLALPVSWYDSALWGQVDAVGALLMLAALILLVEGWSEPAAALAIGSVLVKPQDAIVLVILVPVLVRRHLVQIGSGPVPTLGRRLSGVDVRLGGLLVDQGPIRLASSGLVAALVAIAVILPFDITTFAPPQLADVPILGHFAGVLALFVDMADQFSLLTASAFNAWALAGPAPLASIFASGGTWTNDSLVIAGIPAVALGAGLLVGVGLLVAIGLLIRSDRLAILLGFTLVAFAFYALPTRVHERYLFPAFASGALLAVAAAPRIIGAVAFIGVGALNAINLHAVLAAPVPIGRGGGVDSGQGRFAAGSGRFGGPGGVTSISLPFADLARAEPVIVLVAVGQTGVLVGLVVAWCALLVRSRVARTAAPVEIASGRVAV